MNPNDRPATVSMTFTDTAGKSWEKKKSVPANSRWTYQVRPFTAGIYTYCDAVGVHLFNLPTSDYSKSGDHKTWASTYRELNSYLSKRTPREVAVTSCGWPHAEGSAEGYRLKESGYRTRSYQAAALKDGISELLAAGCRKFWVFQDIDPRETDDAYFGLFSYSTHRPFSEDIKENDAWWVYRAWQYEDENGRVFPDYQKKTHKP